MLNHQTLPALTRAVRARYPAIEVTLVARTVTGQAVEQVRAGTLDLAFVGMPVDRRSVAGRVIAVEEMGLVAPVDHPLAHAPSVPLTRLSDDPFVSMPQNQGSVMWERTIAACADAGFRPLIVQEVADPYLVLSLVAAGVGVTLAPTCLQPVLPEGCVFVPIEAPAPVLESGLAWRRGDTSTALRAVLELSAEVLPSPAPRRRSGLVVDPSAPFPDPGQSASLLELTHRFPVEAVNTAYRLLRSRTEPVGKVVVQLPVASGHIS